MKLRMKIYMLGVVPTDVQEHGGSKYESRVLKLHVFTHRMDIWYIHTYICHKFQPNVGKYPIYRPPKFDIEPKKMILS